jgi:pimeloyl-ACP methyl ester carboxylesterase
MTEFTDRDGVKLAYDTAGSGDTPIVFVHGWACDRSYFAPQFEHFAALHSVATVDLRGHGESSRPEPGPGVYDIGELSADVIAVAHAAGFERPVVIGHSLGGLVALACARGGDVRAAVMVDPAPIVNERTKEYFRQVVDTIEHDDDASWRTGFVSGMFLPTDTARREEIISGMTQLPPRIAAALVAAMARYDGPAALGAVAVPLLSIGSAAPSDRAPDLAKACPRITIGQTVGSGHFNQLEVPDQVNLMIERFLAVNDL